MNLQNHKLPIVVKKELLWYKEIPKEMTAFFGKNCFWIPYKYSEERIMRAWHIAQKEGDTVFENLMSNIIKG